LWYEQPTEIETIYVNSYVASEYSIKKVIHKTCNDWKEQQSFLLKTYVNGDAKVEENRRFEIPVVAARISAFGA